MLKTLILSVLALILVLGTNAPSAFARRKSHAKHAHKADKPAAIPSPTAAPNPDADKPVGWEKVGEDDGITYYKKEIAADPVVALRGECVVDASIMRVASVILDDSRAKEWVDHLEDSKRIRTMNDHEAVTYTHIGTPFILKDRDFVTYAGVEVDQREKTLTLRMRSVNDPLKPPGAPVRGELQGYWKMRSIANGAKTYVITEMHADPKGSIPKWIVNLFQRGWAKDTLEHLRKQVSKPDIKVIPEVAKVFTLPGGPN